MASNIEGPTGDKKLKREKVIPLNEKTDSTVAPEQQLGRTLTQIRVTPVEKEQPVQEVAKQQFYHMEEDHHRTTVQKNSFSASKDSPHNCSYLFSNDSLYLKWVKASAERMKNEIATERAEKRKRKFWQALKERFLDQFNKYAA